MFNDQLFGQVIIFGFYLIYSHNNDQFYKF